MKMQRNPCPVILLTLLGTLLYIFYKYQALDMDTDMDMDMDTTRVIELCTHLEEERWLVLKSVIYIFSSISAPYLISDGLELHLYRNCTVGLPDLDLSLDHNWWKENKDKLEDELVMAGFNSSAIFGEIGMFGYKEEWEKNGVNVHVIGNSTLASEIVIQSCTSPEDQDQVRWSVMKSIISIFSSISAPYIIAEGSLLHLYRNCSVGQSDLDFALDHTWWKENEETLKKKLVIEGLKKTAVFGNMSLFGYEEAWEKNGIKVDIFSSIIEDNSLVIGLWVKGKLYPCTMPMDRVAVYQWRGVLEVRIPFPVEDALIAMYGRNYPLPVDGWKWDVYPFLTGYCSYKHIT